MQVADVGDVRLHYRVDGPPNGPQIVFANSLGTDLRLWDPIMPYLPDHLRILRYDKRGHGLSTAPDAPYSMGALVTDIERLMEDQGFRDVVFVGLSIGGMIAQGLAVKRLKLVRGLVLSNTAAKIGTPELWRDRIAQVEAEGLDAMADGIMERWFSREFLAKPDIALWRNMLCRQPAHGYAGCGAAISGTDFYSTTATLRLPTLAIAGTEDGSTPPDLVRETGELIPGSRFHLMRGAGHLPCVEAPADYAAVLVQFLRDIGHV